MSRGEYRELERLDEWFEQTGNDYLAMELDVQMVVRAMVDEEAAEGLVDWFKEHHHPDCNNEDWVRGFVDGALSKFEEISKQL